MIIGLLVFGSTLGLVAWRPPVLWTNQFDSTSLAGSVDSLSASNDGISVAGSLLTNGTTDSPFLRDYTPKGDIAWTRTVSNNLQFRFRGVAVGQDGIYAVGADSSNTSILKYDFNGNRIWIENVSTGKWPITVSTYASNIYLATSSNHPITNESFSGLVSFVRKYDANGGILWTSEYADSSSSLAGTGGIYSAGSGVFVLTNFGVVAYSLDGVELWSHTLGIPQLVIPTSVSGDPAGVYVSGIAKPSPTSFATGFLTKYNFTGSMIWNEKFDSPDGSGAGLEYLSTDSSGIYLSMFSGRTNGFVLKYGPDGSQLWRFQTPTEPKGAAVNPFLIATASERFYLAGSTQIGQKAENLVQAFSSLPSLVFFGINPPISFVLLGVLIGVAVLSILFLRRTYGSARAKRPSSASPDRYKRT